MRRFAILSAVLLTAEIAGATTNLPSARSLLLSDKAAFDLTQPLSQYQQQPRFAGKVTSVGTGVATILVNRWANEFAIIYPDVALDLHGGGSAGGLPGLIEGKVDIVPMSHALPAEEAALFKAKFGYEPAQILVAQDSVGIYVNKNNPIAGLTLSQLDAIYSRNPKSSGARPEFWGDLGVTGPLGGERIGRHCLTQVHGTYLFFKDSVLQGADYRYNMDFVTVDGALAEAVGADDAGIGFTSIMFATARTRFVPLQAADGRYLLPDRENTLSGQYPLTRPLRIVFNRKPDGSMSAATREFLRFAVSRHGQRTIALGGSYPLTMEQQREALRMIGEAPGK
jgi:phosphate transport system substrate-binding protein